jgi:hypothetical protein
LLYLIKNRLIPIVFIKGDYENQREYMYLLYVGVRFLIGVIIFNWEVFMVLSTG